jgi:hypothetical protein
MERSTFTVDGRDFALLARRSHSAGTRRNSGKLALRRSAPAAFAAYDAPHDV